MAIAAALNILIQSPAAQLSADLKKQGLTVNQFANSIKATYGAAASKATDDIDKMTASIGAAFNKQLISVKELAQGTNLLNQAYSYVQAGGESFKAMLADAAAIEKKHSDGTAELLARLAQLDAMYAASKLSAAAYRAELQAMTGVQAKLAATTNLGAGVKALANRTTPQQDFANGKRVADRALTVGAIGNAQHAAEMLRLQNQLNDATGVTAARQAVLADQEQRRNNVVARHNSLMDEANALNITHRTALETLRQRQLHLNAAKATGILTEHAYSAAMREATQQYRAQTSVLGKLGVSMRGLKSAAGIFLNPMFLGAMAVGAAVKVYGDFEHALDNTKSLLGATAAEMGQLTEKASELGRTTVFSAKDAADGMSALAQAGFSVQEIMQSMPGTMNLAAIGEMEVGQAAEVAARIMAGMQIPAKDFSDAVDSIALAASTSVTTVEELGEALKFVGPAAAQAGMQLEEVMASLSVLANAGLSGELGGTSLRNLFLRFSKPSDEAQAAIDQLGLSFQDAAGDMLPLVSIVRQFEEALDGMGDMEKLRLLNTIFKNRGAVAMSALIGAGSGAMQTQLDLQSQRQGVADAMAREKNDNLWGDFEMLTSALSGLVTDATVLGGALRLLTNLLTIAVKSIQFTFQLLKLGVELVVTTVLKSAAYVMSWLDDAEGKRLHRVADEFGGQNILATWEKLLATGSEIGEAFGRGFGAAAESLVGGEDSELRRLQTIKEIQDEALARGQQITVEEAKQLQSQQKLIQSIDERVGKLKDEAEQLLLGADLYELQELRSKGALQADIDRVKEAQKLRDTFKQQGELVNALAESRGKLATAGMTDGQKMLHDLGANAMPSDIRAAHALDENNARLEIANLIRDAMETASKLRGELNGTLVDKYDELLRQARLTAALDGQVTAAEKSDLARLQALLEQNRTLEKQAELRKKNEEELKKNREEMKSTAEDLINKHNPMKAYAEEYVKLKTLLEAGLIDKETFSKARNEARNNATKSAGPTQYAAAIEKGSAAAYSATLPRNNPELDEAKKQTNAIERSNKTLAAINAGVRTLKGDKPAKIPG